MKCSGLLPALRVKLVIFIVSIVFSTFANGAEIDLKTSATVSGEKVTLGQISEVKGNTVEKEILSQIVITDSPPPCREKVISKERIVEKIVNYLRDNGISVKEIKVKGPEHLKVTSTCSVIDADHLKKLVEKFFRRNYPQYAVISVPNIEIKIPYTSYEEHLNLESLGNRSARLVYEVTVNGKTVKKIWLPVRVERLVEVVVASKPIPRGAKITPDSVLLRKVVESKARGGTENLTSVIGATAKKSFLPGEVIKVSNIEPNFAVRKDQPVRVVYRNGTIRIELLGISLQDGVRGDIIKVKNPSTGKVILCRVTGNGTVEFVSQ